MTTIVSKVLVDTLEALEKTDSPTPRMKTVQAILYGAEKTQDLVPPMYDVAIVAVDGDVLGYCLTEILSYLIARAEKTDESLDDLAAGIQ